MLFAEIICCPGLTVYDTKNMREICAKISEFPCRKRNLTAGCHNILNDDNTAAFNGPTLHQLACPVFLRFLANKERRKTGRLGQSGSDWDAAKLQARQRIDIGRKKLRHSMRYTKKQRWFCLEQVLVKVLIAHCPRAQAELSYTMRNFPDCFGQFLS